MDAPCRLMLITQDLKQFHINSKKVQTLFSVDCHLAIFAPSWVNPPVPEHALHDYGIGGSSVPLNDYYQ